jgi:hypothetical protein
MIGAVIAAALVIAAVSGRHATDIRCGLDSESPGDDPYDVIPVLFRDEFSPLDLKLAEAHLCGELVDLLGDQSQQFRMAAVAAVFFLFFAQRHEVLPLFVKFGVPWHRLENKRPVVER